jgi:hypothetical protein
VSAIRSRMKWRRQRFAPSFEELESRLLPIATTTTLTAMPNATTGGQLVTFTATVEPSPGDLGTVTFKDNGAVIGANVAVVGGVATMQSMTLAVGTHPIIADYSGATGFDASRSNTVDFVIATAPRTVSFAVNGNTPGNFARPQRSRIVNVMVVFDQPVLLDPGALTLGLHTTSVVFDGTAQPFGFGTLPTDTNVASSDSITWTMTFSGNTDDGADGLRSLRDGVYDFKIDAAKVHPLGVPSINMTASSTTTFHRLFGDTGNPTNPSGGTPGIDYQAIVNTADNLTFRGAFNDPANYKAFLDFNGDGVINTGDNLQFRNRFNKALTWKVGA